jgi:hypothetical protein
MKVFYALSLALFLAVPLLRRLLQTGPGETAANCAWGQDGKTLCITASTSAYRIRVAIPGEKPLYQVYQ